MIPNPMRYNETARTPTSRDTLNSCAMLANPGVTIDVPKLATRIARETVKVTCLKVSRDQRKELPFFPSWPVLGIFRVGVSVPCDFFRLTLELGLSG
jgi:hypothetical protein